MTYSFQQWICSGTNRKKGERCSINFFLTRLTNPATLGVVQTVVSRVYYDLKAGRTAALLGPEAARFGYTCVVCGRQYKQLASPDTWTRRRTGTVTLLRLRSLT